MVPLNVPLRCRKYIFCAYFLTCGNKSSMPMEVVLDNASLFIRTGVVVRDVNANHEVY